MSTPTEAHYDLRRKVIFSDADEGAELIADSEAKACDQLCAERDSIKQEIEMVEHRAYRAEAELASERARLDAVVANCWAVHSEGGSSFSVFSNVCGDYIATAQTYRAAIDAAMQEGGK